MAVGVVACTRPRAKFALRQPRHGGEGVLADVWYGTDSDGGARHLGSRVRVRDAVAPEAGRREREEAHPIRHLGSAMLLGILLAMILLLVSWAYSSQAGAGETLLAPYPQSVGTDRRPAHSMTTIS